jgi:hypothetical protein
MSRNIRGCPREQYLKTTSIIYEILADSQNEFMQKTSENTEVADWCLERVEVSTEIAIII